MSNKNKNTQLSTLFATLVPTERHTIHQSTPTTPINQTVNTDVKKQLKDKFKTFTNWNYREISQKLKKNSKKNDLSRDNTLKSNQLFKALLSMGHKESIANQIGKQKKTLVLEQLSGVKAERRQRFKKSQNPLHFIKHYMQRQKFKPSQEEMFLIQKTIELKKYVETLTPNIDIQKVLKKIYALMNLSVDCNQLRFLNLLILLAADICYQIKDHNRAFYFYNESRVASTYANIIQIKTQSIMGMGLVAMNIALYEEAIVILKKNLQYAWDGKSSEAELMIYDYLGQCYYNQGNMKEAQYFHTRFVQNQIQDLNSAVKKISNQMIHDYNRHINSLESDNLTSLFIEYLNLPITDFQKVPVPDHIKKGYANYKNGQSPRKGRPSKRFDFHDFPDVTRQIQHLLSQDYEFKTQIPNPDMHRNYVALQKFGRKKKSQQFQQSSEFHRIIGQKPAKISFEHIYKFPLDMRIQRALSQKGRQNWWQQMLSNTKKQRTQKVGILKQKIRIGHLSYHKYPQQRKRAQSLKNQKIKQSFNKTLLDWIDPMK